ncbi:MAG: hypothetical protein HY677_00165 [Chloroflexi bacterium]|nr:hypothetical protein [Chloroflexota bacterium]
MSKRLALLLTGLVALSALSVSIAAFIMPRAGLSDIVSPALILERTRLKDEEVSARGLSGPGVRPVIVPSADATRLIQDLQLRQRQRANLRFFGRDPLNQPTLTRDIWPIQSASPAIRSLPLTGLRQPVVERETRHLLLRPFGLHRPGLPGVWLYIGSVIAWLAAMGIVLALFPGRVRVLRRSFEGGWQRLAQAGLAGAVGYLFLGALGFLMMLIIVGVPLVLLLVMAAALGTLLGLVAIGVALGGWLADRAGCSSPSPLLNLFLGALLLFPISLVPFIGWPVVGLLAVIGFGAALLTKFGSEGGWLLETSQNSERS